MTQPIRGHLFSSCEKLCLLLFATLLACRSASGVLLDKSGVKPSVLSLPSGPGSIESFGKTFQPQPNPGSTTYSPPVKSPPGTAGLAPNIELTYNSGSGNSPFGQGWSCAP